MTLYKCKCGDKKEIGKQTISLRDGMPNLKRTEPSLSKKGDKLWAGAKEKLIGERGINEDY
jgi:hypothetical protein